MLRMILDHPVAFFAALVLHAILIGVLVVSFEWNLSPFDPNTAEEPEIIEAVVVDESRIEEEARKLREAEQRRREAQEQRQRVLEEQVSEAEQARLKEQNGLDDLRRQSE